MRGKNFSTLATALTLSVVATIPAGTVSAATNYDIRNEAALASCLSALATNTCRLSRSFSIKNNITVPAGATSTLNLNGQTLTANSSFDGKVNYGMITVENGGSLTITTSRDYRNRVVEGKITTEGSSVWNPIRLTSSENYDSTQTAELTVEEGVSLIGHYYGIVGNGSRHNTKITINGGTIKGTNNDADSNLGIFHPQDGELIINGGLIEGNTGIEMRAGKLTVNGGTIRGLKTPTDVKPNGSGSTTDGAGIAVAQHTTLKDIDVTINGGTIEGFSALYESNPQGNVNVTDQVSINVNGGTFKAINGGTLAVYSADSTAADSKVLTINGGKFSSQPDNFTVKDGYGVAFNDGMYEVKEYLVLTALEEAISAAETKQASAGFNRNYTTASRDNLQAALTAAKTTHDDVDGSFTNDTLKAIVAEKTAALNTALANLEGFADKTALRNEWLRTIIYDNDITEALVSTASFDALHAARAAAVELYEAEVGVSRQDEVDAATTAMTNAVNDLVNLTDLRTAINQANRIADNRQGEVTLDSFAAYHNAIEAAEAVRDDATLIGAEGRQKVADAIAAINAAHDALEDLADLSNLDEWFQAVTDKVNEDEDFVMEPTLEGYYNEAAEKLAAAQNIGETQQDAIDTLTNNLMTAFLTQNGNIGAIKGIQESLARYNELDADDYTAASMQDATDAKDAILDYILSADIEDLSAEDITAAVDPLVNALVEAMDNLVEAADTTALEAAIEKAEAIDETLYTEESLADLAEALETAKDALTADFGIADQGIVDDITKDLTDAIEALVEIPVTPETGALTNAEEATTTRNFTGLIATVCAGIALLLGRFVKNRIRRNRR